MRLDFAMLADDAAVLGGKFYIHGGGVTRITAPKLPWTHPRLALCLSFKTEHPEELARQYTLRLALSDPDGNALAPPEAFGFQGNQPSDGALPGEDTSLFLMVSLSPIIFHKAGVHHIGFVLADDQGVDELSHDMPLPVMVPSLVSETPTGS